MSTATEVLMRARKAEAALEPAKRIIDAMAKSLLEQMLRTRVPLIRYGKRKRRSRRMFASDIAAMRVTFDGQALKAAPVTKWELYK